MDFLSRFWVIDLLVIFTVLVVVHEWGHFVVARIFKIPVEDFSIGFGKRLFRICKLGDTEYNVRMLPLGGFVKIYGMEADEEPINIAKEKIERTKSVTIAPSGMAMRLNIGKEKIDTTGDNDTKEVSGRSASDDPDARELPLIAENRDDNAAMSDPRGFNARPLYQRALVIFAGPLMSFVLGWFLFCCMGFTVGVQDTSVRTNRVAGVQPGGVGQAIGLHAGDVIAALNGRPETGLELMYDIHHSLGKPIVLTVVTDGHTRIIHATPKQLKGEDGKPTTGVLIENPGVLGPLGVQPGDELEGIGLTPTNTVADAKRELQKVVGKKADIVVARRNAEPTISKVVPAGIDSIVMTEYKPGGLQFVPGFGTKHMGVVASFKYGTDATIGIFLELGDLIRHKQLSQSVGGIVAIGQATNIAAHNGLISLVQLAAGISISLAIMNLLPIPILDGGHLLAFFIEFTRRGRRMNEREQQAFLLTGLAIIGLLVVVIFVHDIMQTVQHHVMQ